MKNSMRMDVGYGNRTILAILNLHVAQCLPSWFWFDLQNGSQGVVKKIQDGCHGCHLGYQNTMILPILNLNVDTIPA